MDERRIKKRIKAYKQTIRHLETAVRRLERLRAKEACGESMEEGEIRETKREKSKRKTKTQPLKEDPNEKYVAEMDALASKSMHLFLGSLFSQINTTDIQLQERALSRALPLLSNTHKYVILHDLVLFSKVLERYRIIYVLLYPKGIEKDSSETAEVFSLIHQLAAQKEKEKELKNKCIRILKNLSGCQVITTNRISQEAFDGATAIRLCSKALDWDWTYNEFIRVHLFNDLKVARKPFPVYVLAILYSEWNRTLGSHKSLEYILQTLDKIAGVGSGEAITHSPYSLDTQLLSILILRQFRPGAAIKWHRIRTDEYASEDKSKIEHAWNIEIV